MAGVIFPVPIMLLVPIRQFLMPRAFPAAALAALDPLPGEETVEAVEAGSAGTRGGDETVAEETGTSLAAPAKNLDMLADRRRAGSSNPPGARLLCRCTSSSCSAATCCQTADLRHFHKGSV